MTPRALASLVEDAGVLVFRLVRSFAVVENDEMRCRSLTTGQGLALLAMKPGGEITMGQVTKALGVSAGTTTRVIDNLVRDGLVERTGNPGDRRNVCVRPTTRGRRAIVGIEQCYKRFWEMTFSGIPQSRLRETVATLELVVNAVEKAKETCCATSRVRNTHVQKRAGV